MTAQDILLVAGGIVAIPVVVSFLLFARYVLTGRAWLDRRTGGY